MELLPREMALTGAVTKMEGRTIRLMAPLGEHPGLGELIRRSADLEVNRHDLTPEGTGVIIVGHGNTGNERSDETTRRHARSLAKAGRFREVVAAFLDQPPLLEDAVESSIADGPVVVVPYLIGGGVHEGVDVQRRTGCDAAFVACSPFMLPEAVDLVAQYARQIAASPDEFLATGVGGADRP
jgi:sirohydrochlorin ferrochelatase